MGFGQRAKAGMNEASEGSEDVRMSEEVSENTKAIELIEAREDRAT
jgi:hypothetical protein